MSVTSLVFTYCRRSSADTGKTHSQQITELDEKLVDVYRKLQQADAEKKESGREIRFKEVLEDLKRNFGTDAVKGRVSDLCRPTSRKYDTAVAIVLGKDIDSVVVDTHATGVQCMEVRG